MRKLKLDLFLQVLFSLFLIYHLLAVFVMPNPSSLLGRKFARYFTDYTNTLGLNTTWQFFSPGPAPVFYLEYEIETANSDDDLTSDPKTFQFPAKRRASYYDELYNRTLYAMKFFVLAPQDTFEKFFVPWLCRQHPDAQSISVRAVGEPVVNIERAGGDETFDELSEKMPLKERQRFSCETKSEVSP